MAVNLLPATEQQKRKTYLRNYYTLVGGAALITGIFVLAALLLLFDQVYRLNLDTAKTQKAHAQGQAALYLDVEKRAQNLAKQLDTLKRAQGQTTHWNSILSDLQLYTPAGVSITSIDIKPPAAGAANQATVVGSADSRRSAAQFQVALASSPHFKNVEMDTTSADGQTVEYKISFDVNYDKLSGPQR